MSRSKHGQAQHRIFPMTDRIGRIGVWSKVPATQNTIHLSWEDKDWVEDKTESVQTQGSWLIPEGKTKTQSCEEKEKYPAQAWIGKYLFSHNLGRQQVSWKVPRSMWES